MLTRRPLCSTLVAIPIAVLLSAPYGLAASAPQAQSALLVRVAFPPLLRARTSWHAELECAVARANVVLEPLLHRRVEVADKVPWLGGTKNQSLSELEQDLMSNVEPGANDVVLGLAMADGTSTGDDGARARRPAGVLDAFRVVGGARADDFFAVDGTRIDQRAAAGISRDQGVAAYQRGYILLAVGSRDLCGAYRLLAHEIAHLFGGVHRRGGGYLMDPEAPGLEVDPLNAELLAIHRDRGFGAGEVALDEEDLRRLWRLASADLDDPGTWLMIGYLAARMGEQARAADLYEKAIALDPSYGDAHARLGHARFLLGEYELAEECYLRALQSLPGDGLVHNNLAALYLGRGDLGRAVAHLRTALSSDFRVDPRFVAELKRLTGKNIRFR